MKHELILHQLHVRIIICLLLILSVLTPSYSQSQRVAALDTGYIPPSLQRKLSDNLNLFIAHQRSRRWEKVSAMLGDFHGGLMGKTRYSPEQKRLVLEKLRQSPMVSFTPRCTWISTSSLGKPFGQRWWYIEGEVEYLKAEQVVQGKGAFIAYRQKGGWYFTPTGLLGCTDHD